MTLETLNSWFPIYRRLPKLAVAKAPGTHSLNGGLHPILLCQNCVRTESVGAFGTRAAPWQAGAFDPRVLYVARDRAHSAGVLVSALLEDCWELTCRPGSSVAQTPL